MGGGRVRTNVALAHQSCKEHGGDEAEETGGRSLEAHHPISDDGEEGLREGGREGGREVSDVHHHPVGDDGEEGPREGGPEGGRERDVPRCRAGLGARPPVIKWDDND